MSSTPKEIMLNQLGFSKAAIMHMNPSKPSIHPNWLNPLQMSSPSPDLVKLLSAMNSFSNVQANFNMMTNSNEPDTLPKMNSPQPPNHLNPINPLMMGIPKQIPSFPFAWMDKLDAFNNGVNQNVSPASGAHNFFKDRPGMPAPPMHPLFNFIGRMNNMTDADYASLFERSRAFPFRPLPENLAKAKIGSEKDKVITIDDEDEEVIECKPEEFKKNIESSVHSKAFRNKEMSGSKKQFSQTLIRKPIIKTSQNFSQKYEVKPQKSVPKAMISIEDDSLDKSDTKLKIYASDILRKTLYKKKTKKGFLSHRKKHRNQKRREKIVLNCRKCNSRIVLLTKKFQLSENKLREKLCKNCLQEEIEKELKDKKEELNRISSRSKTKKVKDDDTESKSDTISRYKEIMFANSNRILLGEGYQAEMPEFILNKREKYHEYRLKTLNLLKSQMVWDPSEENSLLYDDVFKSITQNYNENFSHYDLVTLIDQYEGDIKLLKQNLEAKEGNLVNLLNDSSSTFGKKRVTRSCKNKFRSHESN